MENQLKTENTFKAAPAQPAEPNGNGSKISDLLKAENYVSNESIAKNIPFVLFLAMIAVFYIWNSHQTERMIREKNKIEKELNELRWEYMTSKNDLMFKSKQTEVIKLLKDSTLQVLTNPPKKIVVEKNDYKK